MKGVSCSGRLCEGAVLATKTSNSVSAIVAPESNAFVQGSGFRLGLHAQFIRQRLPALLILADGGGALAAQCMQAHERALGWLVQRVNIEPMAGMDDGLCVVADACAAVGQPLQRLAQLAAQTLRLAHLPHVKLRRIEQREASQEIVAIERNRRLQGRQAVRAGLYLAVAVRFALRQMRMKGDCIDPEAVLLGSADLLPVHCQPTVTERVFEAREGAAQIAACGGLVVVGPEQSRQRVTAVGALGHSQIGQQRHLFASPYIEGVAVQADMGKAKEAQGKVDHREPPSRRLHNHYSEAAAHFPVVCAQGEGCTSGSLQGGRRRCVLRR